MDDKDEKALVVCFVAAFSMVFIAPGTFRGTALRSVGMYLLYVVVFYLVYKVLRWWYGYLEAHGA